MQFYTNVVKTTIMKRDAHYNSKTGIATFSHEIHYSELIKGSKIHDDGGKQTCNLAAQKGMDGAKRLLMSRYTEERK